jgi:hypothetical protein
MVGKPEEQRPLGRHRRGGIILKRSPVKREREEKESGDAVRNTTLGGGVRNCISVFEGSQAVPARPSGRGNAYDRN